MSDIAFVSLKDNKNDVFSSGEGLSYKNFLDVIHMLWFHKFSVVQWKAVNFFSSNCKGDVRIQVFFWLKRPPLSSYLDTE